MKKSIFAALCACVVFAASAFAVTAADLPASWPKGTITYKCGYAPGVNKTPGAEQRGRLPTNAAMRPAALRILSCVLWLNMLKKSQATVTTLTTSLAVPAC